MITKYYHNLYYCKMVVSDMWDEDVSCDNLVFVELLIILAQLN